MGKRFKPSRAGVINVWDYVDEEWAFADGRLALRGHNGSGKTKALEVLFPFVLDGVADSRRLDPFSGENRTMKSNLLYRGQESEYGYVWMEFRRAETGSPGTTGAPATETVTLIIGMRAHRNSDGVRMSFFVTGKRLGVDFGLLSADSRPLTERQLRAVLEPDAWRRTATEYRDLVDHRLFGLGRERYAQLLDLLLALRRPLLAKDLDPAKVSDTLTAGLSPVDEDLVQQAARDFENLAAVQQLFDDLMTANAAVAEFRAHYEAYLRSHVRFALDRVQARSDAAADHAERLRAAADARRRAADAERAADADREASAAAGERLQGRLEGLKNSEEYKAQGRIEDKRREVAARAAEVDRQRAGVDSGRRRVVGLAEEVAKLSRRAAGSRAAAARHAAALADAAQRSGIADDGFGPVDPGPVNPGTVDPGGSGAPGDDPLTAARARVAARRDDIGEIRRLLDAIRDARAKRAYADQELTRKQAIEQRQQFEAEAAAAAWRRPARPPASPSPSGPPAGRPRQASPPQRHPPSLSSLPTCHAASSPTTPPPLRRRWTGSASRARPACRRSTTAVSPTGRPRQSPPGPDWTPRSPKPACAWRTYGRSATPSPPSGTTRPRRLTCAQPAAKIAPVPRSGSSSGSLPTSRTTPPQRSRVPCTARACSRPGCTQTRH